MVKIEQLEGLVKSWRENNNKVLGCAIASRDGAGDIIYSEGIDDIDASLISTVMSSTLMIGEKMGNEMGENGFDHGWFAYEGASAMILPCCEDVAFFALVTGGVPDASLLVSTREAAGKIGALLRGITA